MSEILRPARRLLVANHMFQKHEWQAVDDLRRIDQLVGVELADRPSCADCERTLEEAHDFEIMFREKDELPQLGCSGPCRTATQHVKIVFGLDDAPHDERSAAKDGVLPGRKLKRSQGSEQVDLNCSHDSSLLRTDAADKGDCLGDSEFITQDSLVPNA